MFAPTRGFSGMADSMEPREMLWGRPLLPWQRHLAYARRSSRLPACLICLFVFYVLCNNDYDDRSVLQRQFHPQLIVFSVCVVACGCDEVGREEDDCDNSGQCNCKVSFTGRTCDRCAAGYYRYPECIRTFLSIIIFTYFIYHHQHYHR